VATSLTDADLKRIQRTRKRALYSVGFILLLGILFQQSSWPSDSTVFRLLIWSGALLLTLAILGRLWTSVHLGRRKRLFLVNDGPYSIVRHPLYVFSILGAVGVAAQTGSFLMVFAITLPIWFVLDRVARIEESFMTARFGASYEEYRARTPRYLPNLTRWVAPRSASLEYNIFVRTLFDSLVFLIPAALVVLLRTAHAAHVIPVLYQTP
jgi:protein-S-isoprenylcysteine O-methyltransferase Ste14